MARIKISELDAVETVDTSDVLPIYNNGDTKKISISQLISASGLENYLPKNNTTPFIPTGDYNPATKKYVDDLATSSVTNLQNELATDVVSRLSELTSLEIDTVVIVDEAPATEVEGTLYLIGEVDE